MIELTYGGSFDANDLVKYIQKTKNLNTFIVQGQQSVTFEQHTKVLSLDYWLRKKQRGQLKDTKQADSKVIQKLIDTKMFKVATVRCPESGRLCKGLELITTKK